MLDIDFLFNIYGCNYMGGGNVWYVEGVGCGGMNQFGFVGLSDLYMVLFNVLLSDYILMWGMLLIVYWCINLVVLLMLIIVFEGLYCWYQDDEDYLLVDVVCLYDCLLSWQFLQEFWFELLQNDWLSWIVGMYLFIE